MHIQNTTTKVIFTFFIFSFRSAIVIFMCLHLIKQIFFILLFHLFEAFCLSLYLDKHHRIINIVPYKY